MSSYTAKILTIGAELLKGSTLNTNAKYLSEHLTRLGFYVKAQISCDDQVREIKSELRRALSDSQLVIVTGGLGPTPDDVTRQAIADFCHVPLLFSKSQFACIKKLYRRFGKTVPKLVRLEALYPENAIPLINRYGIALGFYLEWQGRLIVVLPGVPYELVNMFTALVQPLLLKKFKGVAAQKSLMVRTVGVSEVKVMKLLGKDFFDTPFEFGIYPAAGEVAVRLASDKISTIHKLQRKIKKRLGALVYAFEDLSISDVVGALLKRKKKTLSVAESCSGGVLSSMITQTPGASDYFVGSIITYANRIKEDLGVPRALLARHGAVSKEVAKSLAVNIRAKFKTSYGLSITGVAGPSGGSTKKPVGLVYIGIATPNSVKTSKYVFWGDRQQIQIKAAKKALEILWRQIK